MYFITETKYTEYSMEDKLAYRAYKHTLHNLISLVNLIDCVHVNTSLLQLSLLYPDVHLFQAKVQIIKPG